MSSTYRKALEKLADVRYSVRTHRSIKARFKLNAQAWKSRVDRYGNDRRCVRARVKIKRESFASTRE